MTLFQYISGWWCTYPSDKYESVNWDDDIPFPPEWKNSIHVSNHQADFSFHQISWQVSSRFQSPNARCSSHFQGLSPPRRCTTTYSPGEIYWLGFPMGRSASEYASYCTFGVQDCQDGGFFENGFHYVSHCFMMFHIWGQKSCMILPTAIVQLNALATGTAAGCFLLRPVFKQGSTQHQASHTEQADSGVFPDLGVDFRDKNTITNEVTLRQALLEHKTTLALQIAQLLRFW